MKTIYFDDINQKGKVYKITIIDSNGNIYFDTFVNAEKIDRKLLTFEEFLFIRDLNYRNWIYPKNNYNF